ncbi:Valine--tRNA ligase, chloroplastic/mitochondrial 2 [Gracilariopsis chorda]|uniref:Valine--tRNA ligase, chloroplastic/mitochondrial 2 n=1 Tax=Gracilariopsis chorda TaxID=448386 RepID=A0A2V3IKS7_9FLOR|nr:Valine--tRNA ligase, chloroplastic/mitochondrial 2 [Gracilariopsis chorda]|eukprot:PXF42694.1 Valine--tRNA ligase, chloroplastic/mitochondrial 2 [Gracilariopsis chorda]
MVLRKFRTSLYATEGLNELETLQISNGMLLASPLGTWTRYQIKSDKNFGTVGISDFGKSVEHLPLPERYISKLHILVNNVTDGLETFTFGDVGRQIYDFLW